METGEPSIQHLISLPAAMAPHFAALEDRPAPDWVAASDPPGQKLGSGGGTAHLLVSAWQTTGAGASFTGWLMNGRKLVLHGGGESRRLPAYGPVGKPLMPLPVMRWSRGQRLDQTLLDLQLPNYRRVLRQAPETSRVLVASGDVLLDFDARLPLFPEVDVLGLGMWLTPEQACHFGVFFAPRSRPDEWAFFLQKPPPARLRELALDHISLVDTGMWLLSARAVSVLMRRCGWIEERQEFAHGVAAPYELYDQMGLALGSQPTVRDPELNALSCALVPLPKPEFHHFGTSRQCLESLSRLQNRELDETKLGWSGARRHPDQYLQNAEFHYPLRREQNHTLWVENAHVPADWTLAHEHCLTGIPPNDWRLRLEPGSCLDLVPVDATDHVIRFYGLDDPFRGRVGDAATRWLGRPAPNWFFARGLSRADCGLADDPDLFDAPLFPRLAPEQISGEFIEWLLAAEPAPDPRLARQWLSAPRLSARDLLSRTHVQRLYDQRRRLRERILDPMLRNARWSVFLKLDLASTARLYAASENALPGEPVLGREDPEPLGAVHEQMFRSRVRQLRRDAGWREEEQAAFARLRDVIVHQAGLLPVAPRCTIQEDQIVWGRSPVRLDLAGGWTDTPPYCLEHGGCVLNLAVDLNGQPPIQVFARRSPEPRIILRSIDLGAEQRVETYADLETYAEPGGEFAVAKAALALAGFLPRFHQTGRHPNLRRQLEDFGGGIELSLLAAVPKGSGLGTSSILAATVLGTVADLCGLGWDRQILFQRTLALEQMLTTGGGWQDQAGGLFRGLKLIETAPGLDQSPTLRWLPDHVFESAETRHPALLYYTGITRLAKHILADIVRGIFLNAPEHLAILDEIGQNARLAFEAIQQADHAALTAAIRRSWNLNQRLDPGTNPPEVRALLDPIQDFLAAAKLLGAGGGGFLLLFAKDDEAARRIRARLEQHPPNARARFVRCALSTTGLHITRS